MPFNIITNRKDNILDSGIIPCGISDHDLGYIIWHARPPEIKKGSKNCQNCQKHQKLK